MMGTIRGLTLWRPWPWSIVHGSKRIENRPWWSDGLEGNWIALHAGKRWDDDGAAKIRAVHAEMSGSSDDHPLGIAGVARVVGVIHRGNDSLMRADQIRWYFGPYGWVLEEVTPINPVPCRGAQGLWSLPDNVLETVRERFRKARP